MTIENPERSRLWLVPFLVKAAERPHFSLATTHYCMDGCPWKKPTSFLGFRVNLDAVQNSARVLNDAATGQASSIRFFLEDLRQVLCGRELLKRILGR